MTNDEYRSLWEQNDNSRRFLILLEDIGHPFGLIQGQLIVSPEVDANQLLAAGVNNGTYSTEAYLVEMVNDLDNLVDVTNFN
jgi:hypothetical protein